MRYDPPGTCSCHTCTCSGCLNCTPLCELADAPPEICGCLNCAAPALTTTSTEGPDW